jgi:hypothetical protein
LGHLQFGVADAEPITDVHLVVCEPVDGQVLPELPVLQIVTAQLAPPELVRLALVHEHGAHLAAMAGEVALTVAVDVEGADHARPVDGTLEDPGVHRLAVPRHVAWHAHVQRQQAGHVGDDRYRAARAVWARTRRGQLCPDDIAHLLHVQIGGSGRLLRCAAVEPSVQVRGVPVPPIVAGRGLLERVVVLGGLVEEVGERRDIDGAHRPGSRVVISCKIHPLPSGSLNEANDP